MKVKVNNNNRFFSQPPKNLLFSKPPTFPEESSINFDYKNYTERKCKVNNSRFANFAGFV